MSHKQLTLCQRYHISSLWRVGYTQLAIAREVGVHKSTISRELKRNLFWRGTYQAHHARAYAEHRHKVKAKQIKFTKKVEVFVHEKLLLDWSPEQISGYVKRHALFTLSHERIYQFIVKNKEAGGTLYQYLRHQNKRYGKRYGSPKRQSPVKNRISIEERPRVVDEKQRIGDWEIDTVIGKDKHHSVVTIVERKSKKTVLKKVTARTAEHVGDATIAGLNPLASFVLTITGDNGSEFAGHEKISQALQADFYFAHPYCSWERGLNENTNGLLRQYLKKGSDFSHVTDAELTIIMEKLNNRPRKSLAYATPNEIFSSG